MDQMSYYHVKQDNSKNKVVVIPSPPLSLSWYIREARPARPGRGVYGGRGRRVAARSRTGAGGRSLSQLRPGDTSSRPASQPGKKPLISRRYARPSAGIGRSSSFACSAQVQMYGFAVFLVFSCVLFCDTPSKQWTRSTSLDCLQRRSRCMDLWLSSCSAAFR